MHQGDAETAARAECFLVDDLFGVDSVDVDFSVLLVCFCACSPSSCYMIDMTSFKMLLASKK